MSTTGQSDPNVKLSPAPAATMTRAAENCGGFRDLRLTEGVPEGEELP